MFLSYLNYKVAFFYHVLCSFFPYIWISWHEL
jgi:hypothetical protein